MPKIISTLSSHLEQLKQIQLVSDETSEVSTDKQILETTINKLSNVLLNKNDDFDFLHSEISLLQASLFECKTEPLATVIKNIHTFLSKELRYRNSLVPKITDFLVNAVSVTHVSLLNFDMIDEEVKNTCQTIFKTDNLTTYLQDKKLSTLISSLVNSHFFSKHLLLISLTQKQRKNEHLLTDIICARESMQHPRFEAGEYFATEEIKELDEKRSKYGRKLFTSSAPESLKSTSRTSPVNREINSAPVSPHKVDTLNKMALLSGLRDDSEKPDIQKKSSGKTLKKTRRRSSVDQHKEDDEHYVPLIFSSDINSKKEKVSLRKAVPDLDLTQVTQGVSNLNLSQPPQGLNRKSSSHSYK